MTAHVSDELPLLLTGEASREVVLDAAAHLRSCTDCQQSLVLAVIAHASLTSAQRFAPEIIGNRSGPAVSEDASTEPGAGRELPDLSSMFAKVRQEAAAPPSRPRSHRLRYGVLAAAAAVVVGGGSYAVVNSTNNDGSASSGTTVALQAFDRGTTPATVRLRSSGQLQIDAATLPNLSSRHYEVWLTNGGRTEMQPIGWLNSDGKATLTVPDNMMKRFTDIEVSVQDIAAGDYTYSGTSVLRGSYT
jgi:hypothetical protein